MFAITDGVSYLNSKGLWVLRETYAFTTEDEVAANLVAILMGDIAQSDVYVVDLYECGILD